MKIFINYVPDDPTEEAAVDQVLEALHGIMGAYSQFHKTNLKDKRGDGTHACYFLHNQQHLEI